MTTGRFLALFRNDNEGEKKNAPNTRLGARFFALHCSMACDYIPRIKIVTMQRRVLGWNPSGKAPQAENMQTSDYYALR